MTDTETDGLVAELRENGEHDEYHRDIWRRAADALIAAETAAGAAIQAEFDVRQQLADAQAAIDVTAALLARDLENLTNSDPITLLAALGKLGTDLQSTVPASPSALETAMFPGLSAELAGLGNIRKLAETAPVEPEPDPRGGFAAGDIVVWHHGPGGQSRATVTLLEWYSEDERWSFEAPEHMPQRFAFATPSQLSRPNS